MTDKESQKRIRRELKDMRLEIDVLKETLYYFKQQVKELQNLDLETTRAKIRRLEETVDELVRNNDSSTIPCIFPWMRN